MTSPLLCDWSAAVCGGKDYFLCTTGICIPQKLVCNGYNDCDDWSDETHCGETNTLLCIIEIETCRHGDVVGADLLDDSRGRVDVLCGRDSEVVVMTIY